MDFFQKYWNWIKIQKLIILFSTLKVINFLSFVDSSYHLFSKNRNIIYNTSKLKINIYLVYFMWYWLLILIKIIFKKQKFGNLKEKVHNLWEKTVK